METFIKKAKTVLLMLAFLIGLYLILSFLGKEHRVKETVNENDMEIVFNFIESNGHCYDDQGERTFLLTLPKNVLNGLTVKARFKNGERILIIKSKKTEVITDHRGRIIKALTEDESYPPASFASRREEKIYRHYQNSVIRYIKKEHSRQQ